MVVSDVLDSKYRQREAHNQQKDHFSSIKLNDFKKSFWD